MTTSNLIIKMAGTTVAMLVNDIHAIIIRVAISILVTLTTPTLNEHVIVSTIGCHSPAQRPSSLARKQALCKVKLVFSKPVHAVRA